MLWYEFEGQLVLGHPFDSMTTENKNWIYSQAYPLTSYYAITRYFIYKNLNSISNLFMAYLPRISVGAALGMHIDLFITTGLW